MLGTTLKQQVQACTKGEVVDITKLVEMLGGEVCLYCASTVEKGELASEVVATNEETGTVTSRYTFRLNDKNSKQENNTVLALLLAEYILNASQSEVLKEKYQLDVFFLRGLRNVRMSKQVILATRLVLPESVIEQAGEINFDTAGYARKAGLLPEFVSCAYSDVSVHGILGMFDSIHMGHALK